MIWLIYVDGGLFEFEYVGKDMGVLNFVVV